MPLAIGVDDGQRIGGLVRDRGRMERCGLLEDRGVKTSTGLSTAAVSCTEWL